MTAPSPITSEEFLELVHRHLTPVMEARGYLFCGGGEGRATVGPAFLTRSGRWASASGLRGRWPRRRRRLEPVLSAGFEAEDDDERWVSYFPARRRLDLGQFYAGATGEGEAAVSTREEIESRLHTTATYIMEHDLGT